METTSTSSNADLVQEDDSDLTQLDRAPSRGKKNKSIKREAVIDLEQDMDEKENDSQQ